MVASSKTWDWAYILYTGINWLGYTEPEVWQLSPKKWSLLMDTHVKLFKQKWGIKDESMQDIPTGYIDQLDW